MTLVGILEIRHENEMSAFTLDPAATTIGRAPESQIVLNDSLVSRHHARIELRNNVYQLIDLGSGNGTQVNDGDIGANAPRALKDGDVIRIGSYTLTLNLQPSVAEQVIAEQTRARTTTASLVVTTSKGANDFSLDRDVVTLGRDPTNDIVIDDAVVSRHHAQFKRTDYGYEAIDLESANGLEYDGALITKRLLSNGDVLSIAQAVTLTYRTTFSDESSSLVQQFFTISKRHLENLRDGRRALAFLLLLAPLLGIFDLLLWQRRVMDLRDGDAGRAMMMFFFAGIAAFLAGALSYVFAIAIHAPTVVRQRARTWDITPHLLSRIGIGFLFALYCAAALLVIKLIVVDFSQLAAADIAKFFVTLALTAMSGVLWGLVIYSLSARENKMLHVALVIVLTLVQIVFSGYIISLDQLGPAGPVIGNATNGRLAFIGLTAAARLQMNTCAIPDVAGCPLPGYQGLATEEERFALLNRLFERFADIFGADIYATWIAQGVILIVLSAILYVVYKRKDAI